MLNDEYAVALNNKYIIPCVQSLLARGQMGLPEGGLRLPHRSVLLVGGTRHVVFAGALSTPPQRRWLRSTRKEGVGTQA